MMKKLVLIAVFMASLFSGFSPEQDKMANAYGYVLRITFKNV